MISKGYPAYFTDSKNPKVGYLTADWQTKSKIEEEKKEKIILENKGIIKTINFKNEEIIFNINDYAHKGELKENSTLIFTYTFLCPTSFTPKTSKYLNGVVK